MMKLAFLYAAVSLLSASAIGSQDMLGGNLTLWPKDHGTFIFINEQARVPEKGLEPFVNSLANDFRIDIRLVSRKDACFDLRKVPAALHELGANGGIWIIDDPSLPATLVAPESDWGVINVAKLFEDSPDAEKLDLRLRKFFNRTFANLHGVSDPVMMPGCVMKQAVGIGGIDALTCSMFSPESQSKVSSYLTNAGYKQVKSGTYYDACEQGWAPLPTNDIQRAIWEKVHSIPDKPLKIQFDPATQKGKVTK